MARLVPKTSPQDISNPSERKVAEALLTQLPNQVEIYHSFDWLGSRPRGLQEGECDFIVLDPRNGILFVEVKGYDNLRYDQESETWLNELPDGSSRPINKDPFGQVRTNMHAIMDRIKLKFPASSQGISFTYGYAVAFPNSTYTGSLPAHMKPELLIDASKCQEMDKSIQAAFKSWARNSDGSMTDNELRLIKNSLFPEYNILPVLWRKIENQEEKLNRLTEEQHEILNILSTHDKAAIRGIAGSGKTLLALSKAQEAANQGMDTLFLCYNRDLKNWLAQTVPETFHIDNYHSFIHRMCELTGIRFPQRPNAIPDFWELVAPELLMECTDIIDSSHKYDAVIVDEGQDFYDLWWTSLDGVFRNPDEKGCYYVFFDPHQNIYVENPDIPGELGVPYDLSTNCRNTTLIAEHCAALIGQNSRTKEGAPIGDAPLILKSNSINEGFRAATKEVRSLCTPGGSGGLNHSQVAVLAPGGTRRQWPSDFNPIPLTTDIADWQSNDGVLLTTSGRFKGLEADAVITIERTDTDKGPVNASQYVARSRAKHRLTIVEVGGA